MPILIASHELQNGMRLAEAFVYKGQIMLPAGRELTEPLVHLINTKYPNQIFKIGDPVIDSFTDFEDDTPQREVARQATQRISQCMVGMQQRLGGQTNLGAVDFNAIRNAVQDVIEYLRDNPVSTAMLSRGLEQSTYLADHAGNVFYLSMLMGSAVRDYVYRERLRQTSATTLSPSVGLNLLPLGLGAMFMDLGMIPLAHLLTKDGPLTADERTKLEQHPIVGAEMLPDALPPQVRMIVRTHHENYDGSGYPARMAGQALHIFTRIVRIADAFDAATASHVYRQAKSPVRALWEMSLGPWRQLYDPILMKVLTSIIQPFPIGAKLRLNTGEHAVVCRHVKGAPFQPSVVIAFGADGEKLNPERMVGPLQVGHGNALRVEAFGDEDLAFLHDTEPIEPESRPTEPAESAFATAYP